MLNLVNKKILVISPHIDDVELGMGGTVNLLKERNEIFYLGLSSPDNVEPKSFISTEFRQSCQHLGIKESNIITKNYHPRNMGDNKSEILQLLFDLNRQIQPDIVFIPNSKDIHQAHHVVFEEGRRAFKYKSILGYELPWNSIEFSMDVFVPLLKDNIVAKMASINSFKSQEKRMFFSNNILMDLARVRGKQIGKEYAECFELIRLIL